MIIINGESLDFNDELSLIELLHKTGYNDITRIAVECNGKIVKRDAFSSTLIQPGDILEVVCFVGGG